MSLATLLAADPAAAQRWRRTFPGEADQAAAARRFAAALLPDCPFLDDVLLVVAELAGNALRHTRSGRPGGRFTVEIRRHGALVAVAVTDQGGPTEPSITEAGPLAESGRGLHTVSACASHWTWSGDRAGRTVTAVFVPAGPCEAA
ncbi:ATP-binding protein [Thermomonospora cellulosilytica]|uniref:Anti-sigma regulatory factor (Ser/Thr protein kinase) n=1 Tax=Thermomonospora cellulosilytica TaxID=1411118 RepID=A0A7W3R8Z7_9ACTN|nr:ATP-binding protein [Thermomonospora cellulosilytica]MBA9004813.1 anti-sigma regulatory factor (Ser/Thr protein kinase) [Thermomonospora cellulosilytica]